MAVSGIGGIFNAIGLTPPASTTSNVTSATGTDASAAASGGNGFAGVLDNLQGVQNNADNLAVQAATGNLTDIHNYTIAATEAQLMTDLTVAVRDRAVESFNEIMRMQA